MQPSEHFRFSLAAMMILMAVAAAVAAIARWNSVEALMVLVLAAIPCSHVAERVLKQDIAQPTSERLQFSLRRVICWTAGALSTGGVAWMTCQFMHYNVMFALMRVLPEWSVIALFPTSLLVLGGMGIGGFNPWWIGAAFGMVVVPTGVLLAMNYDILVRSASGRAIPLRLPLFLAFEMVLSLTYLMGYWNVQSGSEWGWSVRLAFGSINILMLIVLWSMWYRCRPKATATTRFVFSTLLNAWLFSYAFPIFGYIGE